MKILINCYACSPYKGSEPGMGWNFVKCISRFHELHIITESKFKSDLDKYFIEHPEESIWFHFYFIEKERHKKLRKLWPPSYYWYYRKWQKKAYLLAKELDEKENFDVLHQLNMVGFRECGYLWKINKPLVWGPTGGMHQSPWVLLPYIGLYGFVYYGLRNCLNLLDIYAKRNPQIQAKHCKSIISATKDTHDTIKKVWGLSSVIIPEVGLSENEKELNKIDRRGNMKIVWSGQHTPAKALNFLLDALEKCKNIDNIELHVLGQGKYTERWKKLALKKKIPNIFWHGWIEKNKAISIMKNCHLLCITSMADLTSSVLMEGLSYGLPVIAFNCFGFANVINQQCGIKIDIHSKKQVVSDYANAIDYIFENDKVRLNMSKGAIARAKDFSWRNKAKMLNAIYKEAVK